MPDQRVFWREIQTVSLIKDTTRVQCGGQFGKSLVASEDFELELGRSGSATGVVLLEAAQARLPFHLLCRKNIYLINIFSA